MAALLLAGVFLRHDTAFLFASWSGWTPSGVFYLLGGLWETILCSVLLVILSVCVRSIWTDLAMLAMAIGIVESVMVWGCKLALTSPPPAGMTNCQHVTGLPIGTGAATVEVMALCWIVGAWIVKAKK